MSEPKPFASLGPTLLARKGGAKPAMRPQLAAATQTAEAIAHDLEDLGWNDMGEAEDERRETSVLALTPAPHPHELDAGIDEAEYEEPEVVRQQRAIAESIALDGSADEFEAPAPRRKAVVDSRRAAFTLRLDAQRHLKLRLASTVKNRSAQALVTQALDKFLAEIPEIEALAAQLKRK
jgi:hypothetical protein